jgi:succinate dehydrogenase/fumarate reductase flavoprotein subunit
VSGGLHGANRLAGNALTEILVFGRRAGRKAAEAARSTPLKPIYAELVRTSVNETQAYLNNRDGMPPAVMRQKLQKLMWDKVGIVRSGDDLQKALNRLSRLGRMAGGVAATCRNRHWNRELLEALELRLMVKTAELIATSALLRTESRGSHYRRDFPETDRDWCKNIILSKDGEGRIASRIAEPAGSAA